MGTGSALGLMAATVLLAMPASSVDASLSSALDNGVIGWPLLDDLSFRPFTGRIFVKGMIDNDKCVNRYRSTTFFSYSTLRTHEAIDFSYASNAKQTVDFQLSNGACNMRRSRKLGPEQRGVEQSITVIISFHDIFITKVDKAYRTTCFYMEADRVVTNRFDVSMIPTTELIDTARMPVCTYSVRRGSVNGPVVVYATGEPVFHVWQCDSDMFSMLVHNCFVDDGAGKDRKPLIDEHGCTMDTIIVPDLQYNNQANLAFAEVQVFKFADKITTYFQCAVSTCMVSEGMCKGKTPPRCGANSRKRRTTLGRRLNDGKENGSSFLYSDKNTMDLNAGKIVVLDLDDTGGGSSNEGKDENDHAASKDFTGRVISAAISRLPTADSGGRLVQDFNWSPTSYSPRESVCFSHKFVTILISSIVLIVLLGLTTALLYCLFSGRHLAGRKF